MKWLKRLFKKKEYPTVNMVLSDPSPEFSKFWYENDIWVNIEDCRVFILTKAKKWELIGETSLRSIYYDKNKFYTKLPGEY